MKSDPGQRGPEAASVKAEVKLFLAGDVMTGRGIDQILQHPSDPTLQEPWMRSAEGYLRLAEEASGPIPRAVPWAYVWGDALEVLALEDPDLRIVNLETAVTGQDEWQPKGINYRMHPANAPCLTAAGLDCCVLANNHVLDWGPAGLPETIATLTAAGIATAGAGADAEAAARPAVLELAADRHVYLYAFACTSSGVPRSWRAEAGRPGIGLVDESDTSWVRGFGQDAARRRRPGDLVVVSIHWGGNWGYDVSPEQRRLAHALIDEAGVDLVHGHSSHHPRSIELHRDRLILYGCGDLLTDYEGIRGHEAYRPSLGLMYFASLGAADGRLRRLRMVPTRVRRFRLERATPAEARWLANRLNTTGEPDSARVTVTGEGVLELADRPSGGVQCSLTSARVAL